MRWIVDCSFEARIRAIVFLQTQAGVLGQPAHLTWEMRMVVPTKTPAESYGNRLPEDYTASRVPRITRTICDAIQLHVRALADARGVVL